MKKSYFVLAAIFWITLATPALAQIRPGAYSLSPFVGGFWFEGNQDLKDKPVYGFRLGQDFTKTCGAEIVFDYVGTTFKETDSNANVYNLRIEGLYHFMPDRKLVPFLAAGVGAMSISYSGEKSHQTRFTPAYGGGLKYFINDWMALRADVRHVMAFGSIYHNLEYGLGLTFYFDRPKRVAAAVPPAKPAEEPKKREAAAPPAVAPPRVEKDSDKDGVPDSRDKCPGTPAGIAVDKDGCPIDSDKDGVPDYLDKCPGTPAGVKVDMDGCPIPKSSEKISMTLKIEFDTGKADIQSKYHEEIGKVADFLKKYPAATGTIEGHTDNVGKAAMNQKLSQQRAESVMNYLVQKFGIDPARLSAKGYGMTRPIADNKTAAGREKNRRIEATFDAKVVKK